MTTTLDKQLLLLFKAHVMSEQIAAIKDMPAWERKLESQLSRQLGTVFNQVTKGIVDEMVKNGIIPGDELSRVRMTEAMLALEDPFTQRITPAAITAAEAGRKVIFDFMTSVGYDVSLTQFSEHVRTQIAETTFVASQQTIARMRGDVMANLARSYADGLGIKEAAKNLRTEFKSMKNYELRRVARTEINAHQNKGAHDTIIELGITQEKWVSARDARTRKTHVALNGEIRDTGERFSNGLLYPGDRSGPISEWIMCRCRIVPHLG